MTMDHETIVTLKAAVTAALEEFDMAVAFHELWKPATYDAQLHERMGRSCASQGLLAIRTAFRREMVLALVRMWDTNGQAVRMSAIADTLKNPKVIDVLATDRAKGNPWPSLITTMRADLQKKADKVFELVRKYQQRGICYAVLVSLRALRHERLAHRQLAPETATVTGATDTDEEVEDAPVTAVVGVADLERDNVRSDRVRGLVRSELFATLLYSALCNTLWRHKGAGTDWRCSWRHAGSVVADLRGEGYDLDWYCSLSEGLVDEQVLAEIGALGWELVEADPPDW